MHVERVMVACAHTPTSILPCPFSSTSNPSLQDQEDAVERERQSGQSRLREASERYEQLLGNFVFISFLYAYVHHAGT